MGFFTLILYADLPLNRVSQVCKAQPLRPNLRDFPCGGTRNTVRATRGAQVGGGYGWGALKVRHPLCRMGASSRIRGGLSVHLEESMPWREASSGSSFRGTGLRLRGNLRRSTSTSKTSGETYSTSSASYSHGSTMCWS